MSVNPQRPKVGINALCRLFNLTPARIGQLVKTGVVVKLERGQYDLWESVQGYIRFLQERREPHHERTSPDGMAWKERKERADALKGERMLEIVDQDYLPRATVEAESAKIAHVCNALLRAVPAELSAIVAGLSAAEVEVKAKEWIQVWADRLADAQSDVWREAEAEIARQLKGDLKKVAEAQARKSH